MTSQHISGNQARLEHEGDIDVAVVPRTETTRKEQESTFQTAWGICTSASTYLINTVFSRLIMDVVLNTTKGPMTPG